MDNAHSNWMEERLASLEAPADWQPDALAAQARLRSRLEARRSGFFGPRLRWLAAGALGCAALLAIPKTRILAQQAWELFAARRVEVVRVDLGNLPTEAESLRAWSVSGQGTWKMVGTAAEVAAHTGFTPQAPTPGVVTGMPRFAVMGPVSFGITVQRRHVELALRHAGIEGEDVPAEWEGAQVAIHFSAVAISEWQGTTVMELKPPVISTPPAFDLPRFASLTLRAAGLSAGEAKQVAARITAAPGIVLAVPADEPVTLREVQLRAARGTLIRDEGEDRQGDRVTLVWSTADRLFVISTAYSEEFAIRLADALTP